MLFSCTNQRTRCLVFVMAVGLLAVAVPRNADAGFCAGDREKLRTTLERTLTGLARGLEEAKMGWAVPFFKRLPGYLVRVALWAEFSKSRQTVVDMLSSGTANSSRIKSVGQSWQRAAEFRRMLGLKDLQGPEEMLMWALEGSMLRFATCAMTAQKSPEPCFSLSGINTKLVLDCRALWVDVRSAHAACASLRVRLSSYLGDLARSWCRLTTNGTKAECERYGYGEAPERRICRALLSDDLAACVAKDLSKFESRSCLSALVLDRFLGGRCSEAEFKSTYGDPFFATAILAGTRSGRNCFSVALDHYDAIAAGHFSVRNLSFGSLPVFP